MIDTYDLLLLKPLAGSEKTRYAVAAPYKVRAGDVVQLHGNGNLFAVRNVESGVTRNLIDIIKSHNTVGTAACLYSAGMDVLPHMEETPDAD